MSTVTRPIHPTRIRALRSGALDPRHVTVEWTDPGTAFEDVPAGTNVVPGNACGTPDVLLGSLGAYATRTGGPITLTSGLLLGDADLGPAVRQGALRIRRWHVHGAQRNLSGDGLVEYLPIRLGDLARVVLPDADVGLVRVGEPDVDGWCSLGPSTSYAADLVHSADLVIAEVSPAVPRTEGAARVHVSQIDRAVWTSTAGPTYQPRSPDETARRVARHVIRVLPDDPTLQLGIGVIGEAVAAELASSTLAAGLRLVGLVSEAMWPLVEKIHAAGNGPVRTLEAMGSPSLMSWIDSNPAIHMVSSRELHDPLWLARIPRLVSVNSALAVDMMGQVVSEGAGGQVLAGVGGSADFFEGAHLSGGGLRVIALRSTTRKGTSTIVPELQSDDAVTLPRHSVDVIVTEHGTAWLAGRTLAERRDQLLAIAAPEHRHSLAASYSDQSWLSRP